MARAHKKPQLIEFKGTTLPVVSVTLHSLQSGPLAQAASELFGDEAFFDGDAAVLELDSIATAEMSETVDWANLSAMFHSHGLNVIGVRGGSEELRANAAVAGLPSFAAFKRAARAVEETAPSAPDQAQAVAEVETRTKTLTTMVSGMTFGRVLMDKGVMTEPQISTQYVPVSGNKTLLTLNTNAAYISVPSGFELDPSKYKVIIHQANPFSKE